MAAGWGIEDGDRVLLPGIGFGAEVEQQAEAFNQLRMVLMLALLLVYAVMASQYESFRDPFIIMFSVPTAAIGVVLSLKLTGTAVNMQAYIGIIMLAGGDWMPGTVIVTASLIGLTGQIPVVNKLCRQAPPSPRHGKPTG